MAVTESRRFQMLRRRRGVAVVESAIALSVTLLLMVAMLDLGLATLQYNSLGHACRLIAREITLRGSESTPAAAILGPATVSGHVNDGSVIAQLVSSLVPTMPATEVAFSIKWPDGNNRPGDRVHVEMSYTHQLLAPGLSSWGALPLTAASTMRIVN